MANELQVSVTTVLSNGAYRETFAPGTINVTQSAIGAHSPTVIVGTSEEDLFTGDIQTPGYIILHNLDGTNFVTYGPADGTGGNMVPFGRIKAGEVAILRLDPSVVLRWKADTSAVKIRVILYEN